jgi:hypothetical protein
MMLSMADPAYLQRMANLRKFVIDYGMQIRKMRTD